MADAIARTRHAEAEAAREMGLAEAHVAKEKGLAEAEATREGGLAVAGALREKMQAEAVGIKDKAEAMTALDAAGRDHEEYRLRLDAEKEVRIAAIDVHRQIAEAQAALVGTGLENAKIDIVGGDSVFFDRLVGAISGGKGLDAFVDRSEHARTLAGPWLDKNGSTFTRDLGAMVAGLGAGGVRDLTVAGLLTSLVSRGGDATGQLGSLLDTLRAQGLADVKVSELAAAGTAAGAVPAAAPAAAEVNHAVSLAK